MPKSSPTCADSARVIKKYPNRRLYDTATSTYITLADIRQLVMENEQVQVLDVKTGEDLTRSMLLQIILEEEAHGSPMFTVPVLASMIRFYGNAMQSFMGGYLEKNMQALIELQVRMGEQSSSWSPEMWTQFMNMSSPMMPGLVGANLEHSKNLFAQMQDQMTKQTEQMLGTFGIKR